MRCKRHTTDHSSTAGVCASCLRERLLSLAVSAAVTEDDNNNNNNHHRKSNNLIFPRSVSPYVTRRKSDAAAGVNRRFITTPQVDIGFSCKDFESNRSSKSRGGGNISSRISNLFRARSDDLSRVSCSSSSSSSRSWISSLLSKKQPPATTTAACYIEDVISSRRPQRVFCRGMSPARETEGEDESESRRTPAMKTPGRRKVAAGIGMGFCLSPLVRASPNCPFKRKVVGNGGEVVTVTEKPHISAAASFCGNRSKKLVDIGRVNHRR